MTVNKKPKPQGIHNMKFVTNPSTLISLPYYKTVSWNVRPCFIFLAQQPLVSLGRLLFESSRPHSDTSHSIGFLHTSDRPVAENFTWQHTTLKETDIDSTGGIRSCNPSKRAATDPRLRPSGHWDRPWHPALLQIHQTPALIFRAGDPDDSFITKVGT